MLTAAAMIGFAASCQLGVAVEEVSPRRSLAELPVQVPVVLLHAADDAVVPLAEGQRLAAVRPGTRLEVFPSAGHGGCSGADRARFRRLLGSLVGQ